MFACLADTVVAPDAQMRAIAETDAASYFDRMLGVAPPLNRIGLRAMLHLLEIGPLLRGHGRRMRRLEAPDRIAYLKGLKRTPLAPLVDALCSLGQLAYYGDEHVALARGYDAEANVARGRALRAAEGRW